MEATSKNTLKDTKQYIKLLKNYTETFVIIYGNRHYGKYIFLCIPKEMFRIWRQVKIQHSYFIIEMALDSKVFHMNKKHPFRHFGSQKDSCGFRV